MKEIDDLSQSIYVFRILVDKFPENKRGIRIFDEWTLKDILAHFSGWNLLTIDAIKTLLRGKPTPWQETEEVNINSMKKRVNWEWQRVYDEFVVTSKELVAAYQSIPLKKMDIRVWLERKDTPRSFLKIDAGHYQEHIDEIKKVLEKIKSE